MSEMFGAEEMIKKLREVGNKFPDRVAKSIYKRSQIIMTEAKRITPVAADGGTLRASGQVSQPERLGRTIWVTLSFGGAADKYAIAVHEHLSEHSPPSWLHAADNGRQIQWTTPGTGPKFLERPILDALQTLAADIAADIHLDKRD